MLRRLAIAALLVVAQTASVTATDATAPESLLASNSTQFLPSERALRGTQPSPQKADAAAVDFDIFVLSAYWWPGHCRASQNIPKCAPAKMPAQWKQQLVVHGLWPSYSANFKKQKKLPPAAQGPDGTSMKCNGKPYNAALAPKTPADQLVFPGQGVSNKSPDFYQYQYTKHGICSQIEQANYFAKAVQLGREASAKFPRPVPPTMTVEALQQKLGPYAQLTCQKVGKAVYLWFVNYCFARKSGVGGPVQCPPPAQATCQGTITF